jgi:hypothetical protein
MDSLLDRCVKAFVAIFSLPLFPLLRWTVVDVEDILLLAGLNAIIWGLGAVVMWHCFSAIGRGIRKPVTRKSAFPVQPIPGAKRNASELARKNAGLV